MKILLVKLSSLGDVVHTLPVVQDILAALPDAQIDWVVEPSFAPVLSLCPGVNRVVACALRRWRKTPLSSTTRQEWRAFKAQLHLTAYDAVIDLQGLTKSALVAWLARLAPGGKRYALANQTDGSGYEAPTRWVADVAIRMVPHIDAVQRARCVAAQALGYSLASPPDYGLKTPLRQQIHALHAIENIANRMSSTEIPANIPVQSVAFVHGTSRADKAWPLAHWVALGQLLNAAGYSVVLAHGNASELATSQAIASALNAASLTSREPPHNSGEAMAVGSGCATRRLFAVNSTAIGNKNNAADRPLISTAADHPPQGVMQRLPSLAALVLPTLPLDALAHMLGACIGVIGVDSGVSHLAVALDLPHVQIYNFDTAWRTGPSQSGPAGTRQVSVFAHPAPGVQAVWQAWLGCIAAGWPISPAGAGP